MPLNFPVTLVIPILNEAESLPELLLKIKAQSHRPDEIIFCDAGSTDGSTALIDAWWRAECWDGAACHVLARPGAMPGAGRNAGVRAARNDWIAFIDGGITPASDWLEQLCRHAQKMQVLAVFGVCHFSANHSFPKAVCALSYGHGAIHPVIPASLFARRVFAESGYFPVNLRAAEDLVWIAAFQKRFGAREVCSAAQVSYIYFPTGWREVFRKWRVSELHRVLAGVRISQQVMYLFGLPALYALVAIDEGVFGAVFLAYLILRGIVDPIRRSQDKPWWSGKFAAVFVAIPLAALLDIAKWIGIVQGIGARLLAVFGFGRERNVNL